MSKKCSVREGKRRCLDDVYHGGYCRRHYQRVFRTGDPGPIGRRPAKTKPRKLRPLSRALLEAAAENGGGFRQIRGYGISGKAMIEFLSGDLPAEYWPSTTLVSLKLRGFVAVRKNGSTYRITPEGQKELKR